MRPDSDRWIEVTPSSYAHERAGLAYVRDLLPDADPYRAWSNLEILPERGVPLEIDLLVLGPAGLFVVELKYWSGRIAGDRYRWVRDGQDRETWDNPYFDANRKARILKDLLTAAYNDFTRRAPARPSLVPWIDAAIFLHHPTFSCDLDPAHRDHLYGPDEVCATSNLPGISQVILGEPADPARRITADHSRLLGKLLKKAGMGRRRQREVGAYVLDDKAVESGGSWQDYLATHRRFKSDRRRVRIYNVGSARTADEQAQLERAADNEYRLLRHIQHPGLIVPLDHHDTKLGPALLYPYDPSARRLDHLVGGATKPLPLTIQLAIIRSVAETIQYAHSRHITHRGLSPRSVFVRLAGGGYTAQVADWQTGAHRAATSSSGVYEGTHHPAALLDAQSLVYQAPEATTSSEPNEILLDVFSLGAIGHLILTGRPPAADIASLHRRLREEGGLDLAGQLDGVDESLRHLVMESTRGDVNQRLPDVDAFLLQLSIVEKAFAEPDPPAEPDPLHAPPETMLAGRYRVLRGLGGGSTAVALLVEDMAPEAKENPVVLKIARDAERADRLREEADILGKLDDQRVARLIEAEPVTLPYGRTAIVVEYAGPETLAAVLRKSGKLSFDRLERWGDDLLGAVAYLDSVGERHRDIKPSNLGVKERPRDRSLHLELFDFSLSRTSPADIQAGTPPYLDPELGRGHRQRWDEHAERYAVTVTLYEMATGRTPTYGGDSHPAVVEDEATIEAAQFDPAVAPPLVEFFRRALKRDARERFETTDEMRRAWQRVFEEAADHAGDPEVLAARATLATPLSEAGLSVRALSAVVEPLKVATVAGLLEIDPMRLSRLPGVNESTRRELRDRTREWRHRLGVQRPPRASRSTTPKDVRSVDGVIDLLIEVAREAEEQPKAKRTISRAAQLLLGRPDPGSEELPPPWPRQRDLVELLGVSQGHVSRLEALLRGAWGHTASPVSQLRDEVVEIVESFDGMATAAEVAEALLARRGTIASGRLRLNQGIGLVRAAVECELDRGGEARLDRRRAGPVVLIAREPDPGGPGATAGQRIDHVIAVGRRMSQLVSDQGPAMPAQTAISELVAIRRPEGVPALDGVRLVRLAAAVTDSVAVSTRDELYSRGMSAQAALRHSGAGFAIPGASFKPRDLRERVRARFPEAEPLPDPPHLDALLAEAGITLHWSSATGEYRSPTRYDPTLTSVRQGPIVVGPGQRPEGVVIDVDRRLRDSIAQCGFLALGVHEDRIDMARDHLANTYRATVIDVTGRLIQRMREVAAENAIPWETVLAADAADPRSRDAEGLRGLVDASLPALTEAIAAASGPVVLAEASPLARYDHLGLIARLADHATVRTQAIWLLLPAGGLDSSPTLDRQPVPIFTASQWLKIPNEVIERPVRDEAAI